MWRGGHRDAGITRVCDFYTKRNLWALARLWREVNKSPAGIRSKLLFAFTGVAITSSKMNTHHMGGQARPRIGTLYIPSLIEEANVLRLLNGKSKSQPRLAEIQKTFFVDGAIVRLGTATNLEDIPSGVIDYIFTDPPFGSNIFYADLDLIWNSWLGQFTDERFEAVWNKSKKPEEGGKTLDDYERLMTEAFAEMHRVLKPGRWASVVFHNSDGRVWRAIQRATEQAGFDLVNAMIFDKEQRSFKGIRGEKGEENVTNFDIVMNLHKKGSRFVEGRRQAEEIEAIVLQVITDHLTRLAQGAAKSETGFEPPQPALFPTSGQMSLAEAQTSPEEQRTTQFLHSLALRALLNANIIVEQVTLPYIDEPCRDQFKKVDGKWYLRGEVIRSSKLALTIEDETSAVSWLANFFTRHGPTTLGDLISEWQKATLAAATKLSKDLPQLLEENFWRDERTNRWRLPTEEERERMSDVSWARTRREIERYLKGELSRMPSSTELAGWVRFCYEKGLYREACAVFAHLAEGDLPDAEYKALAQIAEVCKLKASSP